MLSLCFKFSVFGKNIGKKVVKIWRKNTEVTQITLQNRLIIVILFSKTQDIALKKI